MISSVSIFVGRKWSILINSVDFFFTIIYCELIFLQVAGKKNSVKTIISEIKLVIGQTKVKKIKCVQVY